jgi:site-specific DNA recombinase
VEKIMRAVAEAGAQSTPNHARSDSPFEIDARKKIGMCKGGFRPHHIQSLVQRIKIETDKIGIRGTRIPQTLVRSGGNPGVEPAAHGVRSFVPKWLPDLDSNQGQFD